MEDDVGIYDPDGLVAFAAYFRDALIARLSLPTDSENLVEHQNVIVQLHYTIGTLKLEGSMKVFIVR